MNQKILIIFLFLQSTIQVYSQTKLVLEEVHYYKKNYQISNEDSILLTQLLTKKYDALIKYAKTDSTIDQNLWSNQLKYNRIINEIVSKGDAYKYFSEQLKIINEIKPLKDSQYKKLNNRYNELFKLTNRFSNKDRFDAAFKWSVYDTIYYSKLFANQISDIAIPITISDNNRIQLYKPSPSCLDSVRPIIKKKSYQIALLTFTHYINYRYRDSLIKIETAKYDSLILTHLIRDGVFINSGIINAAVKYRNVLKLRNTQVDSLIDRGMYLNKLKDSVWKQNALVAFDGKDFENIWLSKILEEEQFALLLNNKYLQVAKLEAENIWVDIEKRGLTKGLKKEEAIAELTIYYTRVKASSSMYAYDIDKQGAYARSVKADMPYVLKLIQHARKNNITNADGLKQQEIKW
jgi:hypothetical protein